MASGLEKNLTRAVSRDSFCKISKENPWGHDVTDSDCGIWDG